MKTNLEKALTAFLLAIALLLRSAHATYTFEPTYHDNGLKNIAFFAVWGGTSHSVWVLNICDELGKRGHNVSYLTTDEQAKYGRPYQHVNTVAIGPGNYRMKDVGDNSIIKNLGRIGFMLRAFDMLYINYERGMKINYFLANDIDVAICDHFGEACVDAATTLSIPYIVTSSMDFTKDSSTPYVRTDVSSLDEPTTEFQSLATRFYNGFIVPMKFVKIMFPTLRKLNDRKRAIGIDSKITDPSVKWQNALKLVNSAHGFSAPRPVGPLVELVGPIIPREYPSLTESIKAFLDQHKRVAYIAFGQYSTPNKHDVNLVLTSLLESIEKDYIDGFIWAAVSYDHLLPEAVTTSSGTVYPTEAILNQTNSHARMFSWAPQVAILTHPSLHLFVSHGGLGSCYESIYAGKRMIMYPFFGDQPINSHMIEQNGLGAILKYDYTVEESVNTIKRVALDQDGEIIRNVKRFQSLVQVRSKHSVVRGADAVEEVVYTHKNGVLPHRISADHRMSFIKSHNIDIYSIFIMLTFVILRTATFAVTRFVSYLLALKAKNKIKTK
ncbi:Anthocyanidin 3-O-glucosyltransferase 7 [Choanephora cucurbitarum]|uniref:Anthocyanidin 3-O-glucosyltransferase 7 n=1 Tax=Choanephora cucurbitarum TaxID=101091 RepID=A0A1C7NNF4_9FUNG|nr:Anthocyanidin 3-O-glucosyltransferase 7 [Choanephora cucurbitarum]